MSLKFFSSFFFASVFLGALGACSASSETPPASSNGVNDVMQACQLRVPWKNATSTACNDCVGLTVTPRCPCSDRDYAGKCSDQQSAKNQEPTCVGVDTCINHCVRTDCTCIEACYANKDACRTRASAVDGCVVDVCDSYCR